MIRKFLLALAAILPFVAIAQTKITVRDTIQAYSKGGFNAYVVQIPEAKLKDVEKDWTGYLSCPGRTCSETCQDIHVYM